MAAAKNTNATNDTNKVYPVFLGSQQVGDSELYVGSPEGNFLVKSDMRVDVPFAVKEGVELMEIQQQALKRYIKRKTRK